MKNRREFIKKITASAMITFLGSKIGFAKTGKKERVYIPNKKILNIDISELKFIEINKDISYTSIKVKGFSRNLLILKNKSENSYSSLLSYCPHRGCEVELKSDNTAFECPCHRATFDFNGDLLKGPAKTGLDKYAVTFLKDSNRISIKIT